MRIVGASLSNEISKLIPFLSEYSFFEGDDLEEYVLGYFRKKVGKTPLRAYTCWKFFNYLSFYQSNKKSLDQHGLFSQKLPLVFELIITIQYLHNHVLDEKYNSRSNNRPQLWKNLISSNILREVLFSYLEKEINPLLTGEQALNLKQRLSKLLTKVDIGQRIDKHFNHYKAWKTDSPIFDKEKWLDDDFCRHLMLPHIDKVKGRLKQGLHFTDIYFHRIYLTNVYFFRAIAEIVASFFPDVPSARKEQLIAFSIHYGFIVQIINDYADFAYAPDKKKQEELQTAGKKTTDVFADLYNFNITLPLIVHLQAENRRKIEAYLEGGVKRKNLLRQFPMQVMQEIIQSGGIRVCISLSRDLAKVSNSYLDKENPASPYLYSMASMADSNKFYKIFNMSSNIKNEDDAKINVFK